MNDSLWLLRLAEEYDIDDGNWTDTDIKHLLQLIIAQNESILEAIKQTHKED